MFSKNTMEFQRRPPLILTRKAARSCSCYKWLVRHEFYVLNKLLC